MHACMHTYIHECKNIYLYIPVYTKTPTSTEHFMLVYPYGGDCETLLYAHPHEFPWLTMLQLRTWLDLYDLSQKSLAWSVLFWTGNITPLPYLYPYHVDLTIALRTWRAFWMFRLHGNMDDSPPWRYAMTIPLTHPEVYGKSGLLECWCHHVPASGRGIWINLE